MPTLSRAAKIKKSNTRPAKKSKHALRLAALMTSLRLISAFPRAWLCARQQGRHTFVSRHRGRTYRTRQLICATTAE